MSQAIFIQIRTVWRMMKTYLAQRCKSSTGFSLVQVMSHLVKYFSSSNPNHTIFDYLDVWVTVKCLWKFETSTSSSYESKNSWLCIQPIIQSAIRCISSLNVLQQTKWNLLELKTIMTSKKGLIQIFNIIVPVWEIQFNICPTTKFSLFGIYPLL